MKKLLIPLMAAVMMIFGTTCAFAGELVVRTVNIGMSGSDLATGDVFESFPVCYSTTSYSTYYTATPTYEIDTAQTSFSRDFSEWRAGEPVTVSVVILPASGYKFDSHETVVNLFGNNTKIESKSIAFSRIRVKLKYWPSVVLPCIDPSTVCLDDKNEYKLKWDAVTVGGTGWKNYEVRVMSDEEDSRAVKTKKVTTNSVDLSDMLSGGTNTIAIRTIGGSASKERYTLNSGWVVLGEDIQTGSASVAGQLSGEGDRMVYLDSTGKTVSGWVSLNGCWYYFDPANKNRAVTDSFAEISGKRYYFGSNGVMQLGWIRVDGFWYYMYPVKDGTEGYMVTGWTEKAPGTFCYLNDGSMKDWPLGAMVTDTVTPDGHTVDASGRRTD